ncbi:hypothetical protein AGMMS49965_25380 [Bacteroidia bacterium]|nr:hypothetical protein AGMMS49965_25380 [Bacteroidia bacterium]
MPFTPKNITDSSFSTGKVLKMPLTAEDGLTLKEGETARLKYFTVIGQDINHGMIGSLLINSNINVKVNRTREFVDAQYPLKKSDYVFLHHDSFLNCRQIFSLGKIKILREAKEVGELTSRDRTLVIDYVKNSEAILMKQKKQYNLI